MDFKTFSKNISSLGAQLTPFASRTLQFTKEQLLGQVDGKTQLPSDYIDLEKKVDALKQAHQKIFAVTSHYSNESYDYPPNIKETFQDLGRTVSEKVSLLSAAASTAEAQAVLIAPPSANPQPKTFNHAIARASLSSSQLLHQNHTGAGENPLAAALEKYALAMERVGASFKLGGQAYRASQLEEQELSPEAQEAIEKAEDDFVTQTEEAVGVMKNVLDSPEPLQNLVELVAAQVEYYKKAYEVMNDLAPIISVLQTNQEATYRKGRDNNTA
ncbi:Protein GVP36 [Ophiocordyceps camponoti-floridani]|uniref:Protein GVP36 n=1 Tax=Ophiocordyceps camponoti-floridani TaxID=2030778 RepID=A0A8H4Q3P6_9HYPO|nr:Protein GVP36 [Ophiocordyceps camponoti-floridani]